MNSYLHSNNMPDSSGLLTDELEKIFHNDLAGTFYEMLGSFQRILADNNRRDQWQEINNKLLTLFKCGKSVLMDGPMIGIPMSIRDSDYFKDTVQYLGQDRSQIASIEWMATAWNMTFADTGLWMGKSFEPVKKDVVARKCGNNKKVMDAYNPDTTRIGRNFFRDPSGSDILHGISLPALVQLWNLQDRPWSTSAKGFFGTLTSTNLDKEKKIPYSKTGGIYLADFGHSVLPEMNGKKVYQLNYRWSKLLPVYPMTRLVDEIVQIDKGIYLGQLIYATQHYSLGSLRLPFCPDISEIPIGEPYDPDSKPFFDFFSRNFSSSGKKLDGDEKYGYQNNGFFLMMDPAFAREVYADNAFPQLRPRRGESGYVELGYDKKKDHLPPQQHPIQARWSDVTNWVDGWKKNKELEKKFTTFIFEDSPKNSDKEDIWKLLKKDESILQMLQRINDEISRTSKGDDRIIHFEKLNCFFRRGVAPVVENGMFKGHGERGYNTREEGREEFDFYGKKDVAHGFDYYHGATLNLHLGFTDTFSPDLDAVYDQSQLFPSSLASSLGDLPAGPNALNLIWQSIGKYIFPWAGKSYEKINGRTLSMFLDESDDLAERYPQRVKTLKAYLASAPHYNLVLKNAKNCWKDKGTYAQYLKSGSWDKGMSDKDKAFWEKEAAEHWVDGCNIMDERILSADPLMRIIDMNYRTPDSSLQALSQDGPSPFFRQGYKFLGTSDQPSILPMNNGESSKKKVFQFHYRYPMLGGPMPIGFCLDELVEIADGLFLGQLIYSTALNVAYNSSVDPSEYKYQLFGYFLLLDDAWQYHRLAIGLDTWDR